MLNKLIDYNFDWIVNKYDNFSRNIVVHINPNHIFQLSRNLVSTFGARGCPAYVLEGYPFSLDTVRGEVKYPVTTCEKPALKIRESVTVSRGISGAIKRSV